MTGKPRPITSLTMRGGWLVLPRKDEEIVFVEHAQTSFRFQLRRIGDGEVAKEINADQVATVNYDG